MLVDASRHGYSFLLLFQPSLDWCCTELREPTLTLDVSLKTSQNEVVFSFFLRETFSTGAPRWPLWTGAGLSDGVGVWHAPQTGLLSTWSLPPVCVCQHSWIALQQCWQNSYLPHPRIRTHKQTHTLPFSLWIQSQSSPAPLFPTPGWAQILSALCKPAPLCHQDYRLCCSRLMTDNSTLLSAFARRT